MCLLANAFTESIIQFFTATTALEWCGVVTGLACVWLAAKNNILNWPIACVSVIIYIFIFFEGKLYADAALQLYFLGMNLYGWYYWRRARTQAEKERKVAVVKKAEALWAFIAIVVFTLLFGYTLYQKTDAAFPFIDSFCTACSVVAQVFLARKVLQNWLIWIFVDVIYVGVYFSKELYATGIMYFIYIVIAIIGYLDWKKIYREQSA
ncbi:MAG: nicotinamide riboside transporter PnuC [Pedobacter sp.]|nr:nicotinamide riboside transporter PnuC [Pedobacter sp.]MDQ8052687.1 nicotinamide riboside transporter PnuC [Pedobacter sp.]